MAKMKKKTKTLLTVSLVGYGIWFLMKKEEQKKAVAAINAAAAQTAQSGMGTYLTVGY